MADIIVNGQRTHYVDTLEGDKTVLLLHGWGSRSQSFSSLVKEWQTERNYRFIAVDLPGFGGSEVPNQAWSVSDYAEFVKAFLEKLNIASSDYLVGHSLGGRIVIKGVGTGILSANNLVLIASAGAAKRKSARNFLFKFLAKAGKLLTSVWPLSSLRHYLRQRLYRAAGSNDYLEAGAMKETFKKVVEENLLGDARKIKVPTTLVWGERDDVTPLSEGESLRQAIDDSNLEVIIEAEHFVHETHPKEVLDKILKHE